MLSILNRMQVRYHISVSVYLYLLFNECTSLTPVKLKNKVSDHYCYKHGLIDLLFLQNLKICAFSVQLLYIPQVLQICNKNSHNNFANINFTDLKKFNCRQFFTSFYCSEKKEENTSNVPCRKLPK